MMGNTMQKHDPADAFQHALEMHTHRQESELDELVELTDAIARLRAEQVAPPRLRKRILHVVRES
ncbi:MAG: hypothetical protein ABR552_01915 [Actinomycetota bacterium]